MELAIRKTRVEFQTRESKSIVTEEGREDALPVTHGTISVESTRRQDGFQAYRKEFAEIILDQERAELRSILGTLGSAAEVGMSRNNHRVGTAYLRSHVGGSSREDRGVRFSRRGSTGHREPIIREPAQAANRRMEAGGPRDADADADADAEGDDRCLKSNHRDFLIAGGSRGSRGVT